MTTGSIKPDFSNIPMSFDHLGLHSDLIRGIAAMGFVRPTPIQEKTIPVILDGKDVIGGSQTGTGKTAAFALPILHRLSGSPHGLRALVLEPTRELAIQVEGHLRDLGQFTDLKSVIVYGGVRYARQREALRSGVDIAVATPGRLLDLSGQGILHLDRIEVFVLDEADRMLDMGFAPDIHRIAALLPYQRQTLLFSATIPPQIERLAERILRDPVRIAVAPPTRPAEGIRHALYPVHRSQKRALLLRLLREANPLRSVLIFAETREGANDLHSFLQGSGFSVGVLHADRSQAEREDVMSAFRAERIQILVATNLASRGLDITSITHVVSYDVPVYAEDYIHRIGRTARGEATGDAWTLVSHEEEMAVQAIERMLGAAIPRATVPDFPYITPAPMIVYGAGGRRVRVVGGSATNRRTLMRRRRR
jgi:ATP-dependent RNA helicase RhlE